MGDKTNIEWTDATWNPIRGCSRKSAGCGGPHGQGGCYAEKIAARFSGPGQPFEGLAHRVGGEARWTGKVVLVEDKLTEPLRWRRPRRIFVNSVSDLFHENLPDEAIDKVFAVMALAPQHTFQVLTKRADRMREYLTAGDGAAAPQRQIDFLRGRLEAVRRGERTQFDALDHIIRVNGWPIYGEAGEWPLPNVWLGVSVENQAAADERIDDLVETPSEVRFLSIEPMLGPVDLHNWISPRFHHPPQIDWVIAGGESGAGARDNGFEENARALLSQCQAAGVPFFGKQNVKKAPLPEDLMVREFPQ